MYGTLLDQPAGTAGRWGVEALVGWGKGVVWPSSFQGVSSGVGGLWTPSMGVAGGKVVASSSQE